MSRKILQQVLSYFSSWRMSLRRQTTITIFFLAVSIFMFFTACKNKKSTTGKKEAYEGKPMLGRPKLLEDAMISAPAGNQGYITIAPDNTRSTPAKGDVRYHKVTVFYGTDRARNAGKKNSGINVYNEKRNFSGKYETGAVDINVPVKEIQGIELPSGWNYTYGPPPKKGTIKFLGIEQLDYKNLCDRVKKAITASEDKDEFVFVHGYNNSFSDAMETIAKLTVKLGFSGAPILFTWPSLGGQNGAIDGTKHYWADEDAVKWAEPHLKDFIKNVALQTGASKIHIIAHSMGNRITTNVIASLAQEFPQKQFDQIILAAADVDSSTFQRDVAQWIPKAAKRVTLYASSKDKPVTWSSTLIHLDPRVGTFQQRTSHIFMSNGFESIDASDVPDGILAHAYFAETEKVLRDIHSLIKSNLPPSQRGLDSFLSPVGKYYWHFKGDTPQMGNKATHYSRQNRPVHIKKRRKKK